MEVRMGGNSAPRVTSPFAISFVFVGKKGKDSP